MYKYKNIISRAESFIKQWLQFRYERLEMPGFVVAIAFDGKVEFLEAYGYANLEERTPLTKNHIFRIASHSKTFTATAIMQLAEERLLQIDDPVCTYVPWLREHKDHRMEKVTIRQLLSHGAGIIRDGLDANFWQLTNSFHDLSEFKKAVMESDLVIDCNRQMKYSNIGYALLGCVIEELYEMPFASYVHAKILQPLGLHETTADIADVELHRLSSGYSRRGKDKKRFPISQTIDTKQMAAATGFCSTASDLCKYFDAQFVGSGKLLSDESKKEMQRTQWRLKYSKDNDEYGLGFQIEYAVDRRLFGHGGAFPGHRTKTVCEPNERLTIVVLTNCIDGEATNMAKGLVTVLEHFQNSANRADATKVEEMRKFEGIFSSLWGDLAIVESGKALVAVDPNSWTPFGNSAEVQVLELVGGNKLKITKAGGYYSEGELVHYFFNSKGDVESVDYAGYTMKPETFFSHDVAKSIVAG